MHASINITQFFIFTLVVHLALTAKSEIKKRGLYELPLHQHQSYSYLLDPFRFHGFGHLNFLPEWDNLLYLNPTNLYHGLSHNPLVFNHLHAPWQIFNLADFHLPTPFTFASLPPISFPRAKLPTPSTPQQSPSQQDYQPLNPQTSSFQPSNQPAADAPAPAPATPNPSPPATASHPQAGPGRLGSGSLGVVVLPNGRVVLGSGSLGYAPSVTATPAPPSAGASNGQHQQDGISTIISQLNPFLNSLEKPTKETVDGFFQQLNDVQISNGQGQQFNSILGGFVPAGNEKLNSGGFVAGGSQRPSADSFPNGNGQSLDGFVPSSNERPSSNSYRSAREQIRGGFASDFRRVPNTKAYDGVSLY